MAPDKDAGQQLFREGILARNDGLIRALTIVKALQESRLGLTVTQLVGKYGFAQRSLYRDIEALQAAQFPIHKNGARFVLDGDWKPPKWRGFDDDEVMALSVARALSSGLKATKLGRALDRAWLKVTASEGCTAMLPGTTSPWFSVRAPFGIDYRRHDKLIESLEQAIKARLRVDCEYGAISTGKVSRRVIEPVALHWDPGLESLYVFAWCLLREDVRIFAVHRFVSATVTDASFLPRAEVRSREVLKNAFRMWRGTNIQQVAVQFDAKTAPEIRERRWSPEQKVIERENGAVDLVFPVASLEEVLRWVLGFGEHARVLAPAKLVDMVRQHVNGMSRAYGARRRARGVAGARNDGKFSLSPVGKTP